MITSLGDLVEDIVVFAPGLMSGAGAPDALRLGTDSPARIERHRGGSAANVAVASRLAGAGARFVGNVGDDPLGENLLAQLRSAGVEASVSRHGRTGSIVALIGDDGERTFLTDRASADDLRTFAAGWLHKSSVFHVPIYSLLHDPLRSTGLDMLTEAARLGIARTLDASSTGAILDHGTDAVVSLVRQVAPDILFCNADEWSLLSEDTSLAATVIVKNGGDPTVVFSAAERLEYSVPPVREVVDTTGAGDAFAAGFLAARYERHLSVDAAIDAAHALAARTLSSFGATPRGVTS